MDLHHPIVESVVLPLLASFAFTGVARAVVGRQRGGLAAAIGVGVAVLASTVWMSGLGADPTSTLAKLPWVFVAALVAGVVAAAAAARPALAWLVAALVTVACLGWIGGAAGAVAGGVGAVLIAALQAAPPARADAGAALVVASVGLAAASFLAGSLALFQQAALVAAAVGGAVLWVWPSPRLAFGPGGVVAAAIAWLATAQAARQGVGIGPITAGLLAAALLAPLLTAGARHEPAPAGAARFQPSAAGRARWLRPVVTALIALLLVAAGIGWQIREARTVSGGNGVPAAADDPYLK